MGRLEKSNMSTIGENIGPLSPAATYGDLLNLNNNGQGLINTPVQVQDGYGNLTNIFMSLVATNFDRSVSELQLDGIALTASATTLNNISFAVDAPYIVASSYPSLPNSVILAAGSGISLTAGGGNYTIAASGESAGLNSLTTTGIVVRTGTATYNTASITSNNGTITVTNGSAVSGNPDLAVVPSTTVQNVNVLSNGVQTSTRSSLNFIPSTGISISVVDNSGSGQTDITFSSSGSGGTVTSVSGTTNRITVTNGTTTPVIDISASYVGQSSIMTLGTISTGTWQGTAVTVPYGGTGDTSFTAYSVLCGGTTSTAALQNVSGVGTSGQVLTSNGAGALPTWQAAGSGTVTSVSGTSGQIDVATGTTTPVISISASYVGQASITTLGTVASGIWHGTTIAVPYGGTGDASFTAYSVLCGGTTSTGALQNVSGVGTTGQVLTSNGVSALPTWQDAGSGTVTSVSGTAGQIDVATGTTTPVISISASYVGQASITTLGTVATGTWHGTVIGVAYGGTGLTSLTAHGILVGEGTSNVTPIVLSAGQILIGTTSSDPSAAFISGTANEIDVVSSTGSIVLSLPTDVVITNSLTAGNLELSGNTFSSTNTNGNIIIAPNGTGSVQLKNGTNVTPLRFYNSAGTHYVAFRAGALTADTTWTLPIADSTGTQLLASNGSGTLSWVDPASGSVISVSGTANRITSTGGTTPVIDISAAYVGQTSITTLGTIATGTWQGTVIGLAYGGTNANLTASNGGIFYSTASAGAILSWTATANQILLSGSSTTPAWSTATYPATTTINQLLYSSSANTIAGLATANNGILVTSSGGVPSISSILPTAVQSNITQLGTIATGTWNGSSITVPYGGTGNTTFTAYSLITAGTTSTGAFQNVSGVGTSGQVLTSNGASTLPTWQTFTAGTVTSVSGTSGQIDVATGTTTPVISISASYVGQTSITTLGTIGTGTWQGTAVTVPYGGTGDTSFTAYSVLCGGTTSTGALQNVSGVGTSGYVLTSNGASSLPTWQAAGSGTVTSVSGTANRITSTGGTTPVIDISAAYVGQTSITTLGTITTGTWHGTVIGVVYGGTGLTSLTAHGILIGEGTSNVTPIVLSAGQILIGTTSSDPSAAFLSGTANEIDVVSSTGSIVLSLPNVVVVNTSIQAGNLQLAGNTLSSVNINGNIVLSVDGTAAIQINNGSSVTPLQFYNAAGTHYVSFQSAPVTSNTTWTWPVADSTGTQLLASNGSGTLSWVDPASGSVISVSGTANRITSTGGTTPVIDISAAYVGQTSITTLGTIATGTWQGTVIGLAYGGTNANLTASNGGIFYSTASAGAILAGTATANQILLSGSSTTPAWSTATYPATTTINQLLYSSSANTIAGLATANNGILVTSSGGVPSISSILPTAVQSNITQLGTITSGAWNGSSITVPYGGTGNTTFTAYSLITAGTTSTGAFQNVSGVGTSGQVLTSNGASTLPTWQTFTAGTVTSVSGTSGQIDVATGTTTPVISI